MNCRFTTLGTVCREGGGAISTGPFGSQLHASDYSTSGTPVVMPQDIGENRISATKAARISDEHVSRLARHRLLVGDIVYSRRGDVERRALIRKENSGWLCGTGCLRVNFGPEPVVSPEFVSYYLGLPETRKWIVRHAVGATMRNLNTGILSSVPLCIPDLEAQGGIAEVLGALDDKIAANASLVTTADQLAERLTRAAMTGSTQALIEIAEITMGSSPPGTSYNESGMGVVFYQGIRDFGVRFPHNRVWTTEPSRQAQVGDTLVSVRAPVGKTNLARERTCIGRGLASLRSVSGRPFSLFHILRDSPDAWAPYEAEGTVFGSINKKQLAGFQVSVVDKTQSDRLECDLMALEARIAAAIHESADLTEMRDALMPLLMSGKIRVKDAERVVEGVV